MALREISGTVLPMTMWKTRMSSIGAADSRCLARRRPRTARRSATVERGEQAHIADRHRARRGMHDLLAEGEILEEIAGAFVGHGL